MVAGITSAHHSPNCLPVIGVIIQFNSTLAQEHVSVCARCTMKQLILSQVKLLKITRFNHLISEKTPLNIEKTITSTVINDNVQKTV